eukprot:13581866-Alexandrium_andersonii.AAC.1
MSASLVGSEMCIRDSLSPRPQDRHLLEGERCLAVVLVHPCCSSVGCAALACRQGPGGGLALRVPGAEGRRGLRAARHLQPEPERHPGGLVHLAVSSLAAAQPAEQDLLGPRGAAFLDRAWMQTHHGDRLLG